MAIGCMSTLIWLCGLVTLQCKLSEGDCAQLEEAASSVKVIKVKVDVGFSDKASKALAVGFSKNPLLREVELGQMLTKESAESAREMLKRNATVAYRVW